VMMTPVWPSHPQNSFQEEDRFARFLSILVFLGGIGGLGVCFYFAWHMLVEAFTRPLSQNLGAEVSGWLIRLLLLLVMGYLSSSVAGRGIDLYWAARYKGASVSAGARVPKGVRESAPLQEEKEEAKQEG
jgi:hypothetical protein